MIFRHQPFYCKVAIFAEIFRFYQTASLHSMFQQPSFRLNYSVDRQWPVFNMEAVLMFVVQLSWSASMSGCSSVAYGYLELWNPSAQRQTRM
jgi:hypothetical protein